MENFEVRINPPNTKTESTWMEICQDAYKHNAWRSQGKIDYDCWVNGIPTFEFAFLYDKENGRRAGCISAALDESEELAHIGFFFFLPEYRGKGVGTELFEWTVAKEKFRKAKNWTLLAAHERVEYYKTRHGFDKLGWTFSPVIIPTKELRPDAIKNLTENQDFTKIEFVLPKSLENWQNVFEYNRKFFGGFRRDKFVKTFLSHPEAHAKIALDKESGNVTGIGCIRETATGNLILGPLYADSPEIAETIFFNLLATLPWDFNNYELLITVPISENTAMREIACKIVPEDSIIGVSVLCQAVFTDHVIDVPRKNVYSNYTTGLFVV
ncbi:acetyltransferase (GNAT) family domain-containing protein [Ditylenchus destructor]|uniref:Acetyltransferase (GNAT) family domain-containing protein n=1 Tax=Ditylenchus destructor TaxID=166010 RepID=A0AAD4MUR8_9BILA|nr:acetyltransferase (GNAT) family domain-containing protein [Ditylenchus destructor]